MTSLDKDITFPGVVVHDLAIKPLRITENIGTGAAVERVKATLAVNIVIPIFAVNVVISIITE